MKNTCQDKGDKILYKKGIQKYKTVMKFHHILYKLIRNLVSNKKI